MPGLAPLLAVRHRSAGNTDLGRSAEGCILETYPKVVSKVLARRCPCPAAAASEELLKNIAKNVPHAHTGAEPAEAWATLRSGSRSILVVVGTFLGLIELVCPLISELLRLLCCLIFVRMVLGASLQVGA
jgi:hypothetical protein